VTQSHKSSDNTPRDGDEGDPPRRRDIVFENEVRWDFGQDVSDEEDRHGDLELVARHVEVFLESIKSSIADVHSLS